MQLMRAAPKRLGGCAAQRWLCCCLTDHDQHGLHQQALLSHWLTAGCMTDFFALSTDDQRCFAHNSCGAVWGAVAWCGYKHDVCEGL